MTAREDLFAAIVAATVRGRCDETEMVRLVDAVITEALVAAGVQYLDCQVCGAARPVVGDCPTCAFKARMAAELAARGMANPAATAPPTATPDTLANWLYRRFDTSAAPWEDLDLVDREYWEREAKAVRRAVARGGFRTPDPKAGAR